MSYIVLLKFIIVILIIILTSQLFTKNTDIISSTISTLVKPVYMPDSKLSGVSPEGVEKKFIKPPPILIPIKILKLDETTEDCLVLNGTDFCILPANDTTNIANFDVKTIHTDQILYFLTTKHKKQYVCVSQKDKELSLSIAIFQNQSNINDKKDVYEFTYTVNLDLTQYNWVKCILEILPTIIIFTLDPGNDKNIISLTQNRDKLDTGIITDTMFSTLYIGGKPNQDERFAICKLNNVNIFGTEFGKFNGNGYAQFPLNLRKHLTTYPIDISFDLETIVSNATLFIIYENDNNYLKTILEDGRVKIIIKSKGKKFTKKFKHVVNVKPISLKILIDDAIILNIVTVDGVDSSTVRSETSDILSFNTNDIYWISSAFRIFIGGFPGFPSESFKGILNNIHFQDVTSLF